MKMKVNSAIVGGFMEGFEGPSQECYCVTICSLRVCVCVFWCHKASRKFLLLD